MATIVPTVTRNGDGSVIKMSYETLTTTNDVGSVIAWPEYWGRTIQVLGTFGAGGTLLVEGSNDGGTTWATLDDGFGDPLSITAAGIYTITAVTELTRVRVSAGDGTTDLDVHILCVRPTSMRQ